MLLGLGGRSTAPVASADRTIPGPGGELGLRVYTPGGEGIFPILCFFHGGGFVLGDLRGYDGVCKELAAGAGAVVVSVDYRLAPEHPFPASTQDAEAAVRWVAANAAELGGDPARIAVGGDSAGGNLAAGVAQRLRQGGPPLVASCSSTRRCAWAARPPVRCWTTPRATSSPPRTCRGLLPHHQGHAEGYFLTTKDMEWFLGHYLADPAPSTRSHRRR